MWWKGGGKRDAPMAFMTEAIVLVVFFGGVCSGVASFGVRPLNKFQSGLQKVETEGGSGRCWNGGVQTNAERRKPRDAMTLSGPAGQNPERPGPVFGLWAEGGSVHGGVVIGCRGLLTRRFIFFILKVTALHWLLCLVSLFYR